MKRFILVCLTGLLLAATALNACNAKTTNSTTTDTPSEAFVFPDQGIIRISGDGYFRFQRVLDRKGLYDPAAEAINYEGVIFKAHKEQPGVTSTGPIMYKIDVQFTDGTVEVLQYIGLANRGTVDINLTQHEHPKAGVLMSWDNSQNQVLYLMVSEQ